VAKGKGGWGAQLISFFSCVREPRIFSPLQRPDDAWSDCAVQSVAPRGHEVAGPFSPRFDCGLSLSSSLVVVVVVEGSRGCVHVCAWGKAEREREPVHRRTFVLSSKAVLPDARLKTDRGASSGSITIDRGGSSESISLGRKMTSLNAPRPLFKLSLSGLL
jgi:hypothetical protein